MPKILKLSPLLHSFTKKNKKMSLELLNFENKGYLFFGNPPRTQIVTFWLGQKGCDYCELRHYLKAKFTDFNGEILGADN